MGEGLGRAQWQHTSSILAMLANCNRGKHGRPYSPADFDPYDREPGEVIEVTPETIGTMKQAFCGKKATG